MRRMKKNDLEIVKDTVTIKLNRYLYTKRAVIVASEAFSESCFVSLNITPDAYVVAMKPKEEMDLKTLGYEFFNYVLGIMQND